MLSAPRKDVASRLENFFVPDRLISASADSRAVRTRAVLQFAFKQTFSRRSHGWSSKVGKYTSKARTDTSASSVRWSTVSRYPTGAEMGLANAVRFASSGFARSVYLLLRIYRPINVCSDQKRIVSAIFVPCRFISRWLR